MNAERDPLQRMCGQHPAALRSVSWDGEPMSEKLQHLELETKHGMVVVFDQHTLRTYSNPPRPAVTRNLRQWRDLTETAPAVFDNRPTITIITRTVSSTGAPCWRVELSTRRAVIFVPDPITPLLWCE